jgi:hypothetical protein
MPTNTPLQSIKLNSSAASVTFTNIDQTYTDLYLVISCLASSTTTNYVNLQFNGDTGANYSSTVMAGTGSSPISSRWSNRNNLTIDYYATPSNTEWGMRRVDIFQYSNSTVYKTIMSRADRGGGGVDAHTGTWRNFLPITSITINLDSDTFAAGSTFSLYGISPVNARVAQASGGTSIAYDSSYVYHVFNGTGTFTPTRNLTADILVVAGGGGSTWRFGGGGGAGGVVALTSQSLTGGTSYTCTVGAGGANGGGSIGGNGGNSQFGALTAAVGGGSAGGSSRDNGANGGSGGGGGGYTPGIGGTGTGTQGNSGGNGATNVRNGGGGGGAGVAGEIGNANHGGNGGAGTSAYSSWGLATNTGQNVSGTVYYAGGGGGAANLGNGGSDGTWDGHGLGGNGGGGNGGAGNQGGGNDNLQTEANGLANTGGGAGGNSQAGAGGTGGSGLIIVRYAR